MTGATFVDLDGTLIKGNSMHIFMRRLPAVLLKRKPFAAVGALWWLGLRSIRLAGHRRMKWHLTRLARRNLTDSDWKAIAERIAAKANPLVKGYVDDRKRRGCEVYIASAAPEEYCRQLSALLGYDGAIATKFFDEFGDYEELRGLAKRDAIEWKLTEGDLRLESFLTDHTDDLPTAREFPNLTILVDPDRKTRDQFRHIGVTRYLAP